MKKYSLMVASSAISLALCVAAPAFAQDAPEEPAAEETVDAVADSDKTTSEEGGDKIVVTGSRIKKDTFNSVSPIQVLTTQEENEAGLFDASQILQRSESAAGQQIDATFQGFVLNNGPGSQTLNLRGLGADRTLLLINGRRLAPAGVEGAPTNPSINLLPSLLIDRYDLLLDGASSVYGSDAVAGVGNIILRKDFDGFELTARGDVNPQGGGEDYTIGGAWGFNSDRGFFGIGAQYDYTDTIRLNDRDFFKGCDRNYEVDQNGNILTVGLRDNALVRNRTPGVRVSESECKITGITGRIFVPFTNFGSIYFDDRTFGTRIGNSGVPFFSESTSALGREVDANGDGIRDVDFQDYNTNATNLDAVFQNQQQLYNVMAYGEYTLAGDANITPYFEAMYSRAEVFADNTGSPQLFPYVPDNNRFNPCFRAADGGTGVDCPLADNVFLGGNFNPNVGLSLPVIPIVSVRGDRNDTDVTLEQYRGVFGVKGDLPFISPSWSFDASFVYSRSNGTSIRRGIRQDKLAFALGLDPTADYNGDGIVDRDNDGIADDYDFDFQPFGLFGDPQVIGPCNAAGLANPSLALPDLTQGCVPVNLFAPSLLDSAIGDFASQAERDYVFGERTFKTKYEQKILSAFATGDLFDLPAGPVGAVIGFEIREDKIDSRPNEVAANGLLFGFFKDRGAVGDKTIKEAFAEIDIPLKADQPWVRELNLNLAGRITDEEFYGTNFTYSVKANWRPIDPLNIKFTYGSSFRAPNLRENFLLGQSGFLNIFDPCAVPANAFLSQAGGYQPQLDTRDASILANCIREGRDPTVVGVDPQGLNVIQTVSAEILTQGSFDIDPETSRSITAGAAFEESFGGWDVSLAGSYFDIKLKESIVELGAQFAVNDCYTRDDNTVSPFCSLIVVSQSPATRFLIDGVNPIFINLDQESVRGVDINANISKEVRIGQQNVDFNLAVRANHLIERSTLFIDQATGIGSFDDDAGEFGLPKWNGRATLRADVNKWRFTWQVDYTGPVAQDPLGVDAFADAFGRAPGGGRPIGPLGTPVTQSGDTCLGNGSGTFNATTGVFTPNGRVPGDNVFCRDVGFAKAQFLHTASIRYRGDRFNVLLGVSNIFNTPPPLVDSDEVLAIGNTAIGTGYDYDGREFFVSVEFNF
jgi:iron complex outermembrane receptor protein